MSNPLHDNKNRREFLLSTGATLLLGAVGGISGCGGGSKSPQSDSGSTTTSTVNNAEIFDAPASVVNISAGQSVAVQSGTYTISASQDRAEMLFASNSAGALLALGISIPDGTSNVSSMAQLGSTSTAMAMVFMTPGIGTTIPVDAAQRVQEIQSLQEFDALNQAVSNALTSQSFSDMLSRDDVSAAAEACATAWINQGRSWHTGTRDVYLANDDRGRSEVNIVIADASDEAKTGIRISNVGWRYVTIQRRFLRAQTVVKVDTAVPAFAGGEPFSWGSVLNLSVGKPHEATDKIDLSQSRGADVCEYWITGPGYNDGKYPLPEGINSDLTTATGFTLIYYGLFPLLNILAGVKVTISESFKIAQNIWEGISGGIDLTSIVNAETRLDLLPAIIEVLVTILELTLKNGDLVARGILSKSKAEFLELTLKLGAVFSVANAAGLAINWNDHARFSMISVARSIPPPSSTGPTPPESYPIGPN